MSTEKPTGATAAHHEPSVGELVAGVSEQVSRLVRDELRLAQLDLKEKGKKAGIGIGAFSVAGLLAFLALGALVACAIIALSNVVAAWLAALLVAVALLVVAGIAALVGKKEVSAATPAVPQEVVEGVKKDVSVVKEAVKR